MAQDDRWGSSLCTSRYPARSDWGRTWRNKKKGSSMVRNAPKIRIVKPDIRQHNGKMPDVQPKMQQILKMASSAHLLKKTLPVPVL